MPKPSEEHAAKVFELLLAGLSSERISAWAQSPKNTIGLQVEDLPELTKTAEARLREYSKFRFDEELGKSLKRMDELYARSLQIQDFKGAAGIERERAKLLQSNRRPEGEQVPAGEPPAVPRMLPLAEVAKLLHVSPRCLQNWCKSADDAHKPPMPHVARGKKGLIQLDPAAASEHLRMHAPRTRGLKPWDPTAAEAPADRQEGKPEGDELAEIRTVRELLQTITLNPAKLHSTPPDLIRALTAVESAILRREVAETKRLSWISPEEYEKNLKACLSLLTEHVETQGAKRMAVRVLETMRTTFNTDLGGHAAAVPTFEAIALQCWNESLDCCVTALRNHPQRTATAPQNREEKSHVEETVG